MSIQQENANQPIGDPSQNKRGRPTQNYERRPGPNAGKMEQDLESLREQQREKLLVLHD